MHVTAGKRGRRRLRLTLATVAASFSLVLSACGGGASSSGASDSTLTLAATASPVSLNPMLQNTDPVNNWFINLAYDPLIRIDNTGKLVPDLATEWRYTDDTNTAFQLTLRQGVTFSDGTPLTAQAVVDSINYGRKFGVNGPNWLGTIKNVTAADNSTVVVTTTEPNDSLAYIFTQRLLLGSVISPQGTSNPESLKSSSHGAGPYVLDTGATIANDTYVYVPNTKYWDQSKIKWKGVKIKVVANATAALQAVRSGEVRLFRSDATTAEAATASGLGLKTVPYGLFGVNYGDRRGEVVPALANPKVRQALSYAIDRASIAKAVYGQYAKANATLSLNGFAGFSEDDANAFAYNPAKAKQMLSEAGYPNGFSFNMATTTSANTNTMAQAVVENWKQIGVTANLTTFSDEGQLITEVIAHKYPVTAYAYGALPMYLQAKSYFTGGSNQYNPWNTADEQISTALSDAARAKSPQQQEQFYTSAVHRAIVDLAWMSNVFTTSVPMVYNPTSITGVDGVPTAPSPDVAWSVAPASK